MQVGHTCHRKLMKGHLAARGLRVSKSQTSDSLQRVHPDGYEAQRSNTFNCVNPTRHATKFGHKLPVDQNEKLIEYGVTHEIATDGFSGKVINYFTLPIKNNMSRYDQVYRCVEWFLLTQLPSISYLHTLLTYAISVHYFQLCRPAVGKYEPWDQQWIDHELELWSSRCSSLCAVMIN